ncbi:hypothetical protein D9619_009085 [Psilocybe cf. subviscida]|uniref:holo-[acyl-carrier-protein] synthase n=1 Tax=Psilocybe cf. subviscida TaxID=2480587 RepID=A0A8H5FA85_9AGAR|nr:hypothetical protein D9619_009085 [Psilocybe cf. subviscida]
MSSDTVLVWMLSLNREYTKAEYHLVYNLCKTCFPETNYKYDASNADSFRVVMTQLLPVLMMRHRRVPRAKWQDHRTPAGKHWIELVPDGSGRPRNPLSIGYQLTFSNSLCGMAVTQGLPSQVVHIGLGIRQLKVEPRGVTLATFFESNAHKLTQLEITNITAGGVGEDVVLKRLCINLALKDAYVKALGQPLGIDYSRLQFDLPNRTAICDGNPMIGWEFRLFGAKLGVARGIMLKEEQYECVCAYYRGNPATTFIFYPTPQELENWVQFINIDQLMAVAAKLAA